MKNVPSIVAMLAISALTFAGNSPTKLDGSPTQADIDQLPPTLTNPVAIGQPPLIVTTQPDQLVDIRGGELFTEPRLIPTTLKAAPVVSVSAPASCGPGGCSTGQQAAQGRSFQPVRRVFGVFRGRCGRRGCR